MPTIKRSGSDNTHEGNRGNRILFIYRTASRLTKKVKDHEVDWISAPLGGGSGHCILDHAASIAFDATTTTQLRMGAVETDDKKRVVVTGLGVISGCGIGHEDFFQACVEGKSSLGRVKRFDIDNYTCQIASEVPEEMFVAADHFTNPKNARSNDRYTHFAVAAARLALKDAGVGDTPETLENPERIGVMVGSAFGGMETFEQETLKLAAKPERPKVSCRMHFMVLI